MFELSLVVLIIALALLFDFFNGFNDAANSVATIVATRVLTPLQAVVWAAFFNFVSAFSFGTGVARTVGSGMVDLDIVTPYVILGGLMGAILWTAITSWLGLPISCSHALFGGYAGAAMARVTQFEGLQNATSALIWSGWTKTLIFMVLAPVLGLALAYAYMLVIYWLFRRSSPKQMDVYFRRLQLLSAAAYSYSHGTNDAQKTMGIIAGVLYSAGYLSTFYVPLWVVLAAHAAIALGTLAGGWRVVRTVGTRITRLRPRGGFAAETAAATSILISTALHVGVSTTHVIGGAIAGVGSAHRRKAVRWSVATRIVWAWILTIPASAAVAWLSYSLIYLGGFDPR